VASSEILTTASPPGECVPPAFDAWGGHTAGWRGGWGVNSSEDARHCYVLYLCKYFEVESLPEPDDDDPVDVDELDLL
jgi:hypothetical protein